MNLIRKQAPGTRKQAPNLLRQSQSAEAAAISREALDGVHVAHCCWIHGCKYGGYNCAVTDPDLMIPQDHACEACKDEIREWWPLILVAQQAYDAGRRAGQIEGARHGFTEGSFQGFRQGRVYAETGRLVALERLDLAPRDLEVTPEMIEAFGKAWEQADAVAMPRGSGARRLAGLSAVIAIVRRDVTSGEGGERDAC